jgi:hypothetical protein
MKKFEDFDLNEENVKAGKSYNSGNDMDTGVYYKLKRFVDSLQITRVTPKEMDTLISLAQQLKDSFHD